MKTSSNAEFWKRFGVMSAVLLLLYALRPNLATGTLWLFVILAAAEVFAQGKGR